MTFPAQPRTYALRKFLYEQQLPLPAEEDPAVSRHGASGEPGCGWVVDPPALPWRSFWLHK